LQKHRVPAAGGGLMADLGINGKESLGEKVTSELREFAILSGYLYVCFTALAYFKASILHAHEIDFAPWAFAAIKALLSAKFMLIGRALNVGEGFKSYPLIVPTLYKSCIFLVLVLGLTVIEEAAVGYLHGRKILDSMAELGGGTAGQMIATSVILLLIFIPYFAFRSLGDIIGNGVHVRLYFERRR